VATIQKYQLGPYAEGDVLSLHAAVLLRDASTSPAQAKKRFEEAITILSMFDRHLAAKATVMMAAAKRREADATYLSTLKSGIAGLDQYREPRALEGAHTNLLHYLVSERRIEETRRWQIAVPYPKDKFLKVYRQGVDGCAEIIDSNLDLAEILFRSAKRRATALGCREELISILLYLAFIKHEKRDSDGCRRYVEKALAIATGFGLNQTPAIAALLVSLHVREDISNRLLTEAAKAGGCLGPKAEAP